MEKFMLEQQANVFRLSAIIYANNNYQISPLLLHKKIVEDALYQLHGATGITRDFLADYIEKSYQISFSDEELDAVLKNKKFSDVFACVQCGVDVLYSLVPSRLARIDSNKAKNLDDFIKEYLVSNDIAEEKGEVIYRYLYGVFTTNVDSFSRMIEAKTVKVLVGKYAPNEDEYDVINGFLDWKNEGKDIAIFNLASYALEYCLLTSKKDTNVKIDSLQHKTFYLDTNILYRAIGVDGADRKQRTLSFFKKMRESNNEIRISRLTWEEYEGSMKQYIKKLRKSETPAIQSKVYTEYVSYDSIYKFYHTWAQSRKNTAIATVDYFESMLASEMKSMLEDNKITIDGLCPFSIESNDKILKEMAAQIKGLSQDKWFDSAYTDACNVMWIEHMRGGGETSIFSTKTFLLSSDWGLYIWDSKYHSKNAPIVLLPSQWLSILLRYVSRSSDDFRSFVCFLNIQPKEGNLTAEQINSILEGISEVTADLQQQKHLLDAVIENDFKKGPVDMSRGQIKSIAKNSAQRLMQKELDKLKNENEVIKKDLSSVQSKLSEQKNQASELAEAIKTLGVLKSTISEMKEDKSIQTSQISNQEKEISTLRDALNNSQSIIWKHNHNKRIAFRIIPIVVIIVLIIWFFCSSVESDNWMGYLLKWISELDDTQNDIAKGILLLIVSAVLIPLMISFYKVLKDKK